MEFKIESCTGVFLRADLTGHGRKGLDGHALLGQPSKGRQYRNFSHFSILFYCIISTTYQKIGHLFCPVHISGLLRSVNWLIEIVLTCDESRTSQLSLVWGSTPSILKLGGTLRFLGICTLPKSTKKAIHQIDNQSEKKINLSSTHFSDIRIHILLQIFKCKSLQNEQGFDTLAKTICSKNYSRFYWNSWRSWRSLIFQQGVYHIGGQLNSFLLDALYFNLFLNEYSIFVFQDRNLKGSASVWNRILSNLTKFQLI